MIFPNDNSDMPKIYCSAYLKREKEEEEKKKRIHENFNMDNNG